MPGPLTAIAAVKEYEETYLPLFLWEFTFTDGSWAGFSTHGLLPAEGGFTYKGRNYEGLVLNGDVAAAQAMSSNGVTMFPSLQLELDDADRVLTTNVEIEGPGFKGAQVILRFLFYDPTATSSASAFSTDDLPLFLGSCITSPEINDATIRVTIQSLLHLAQGTLPSIHIQKRCPWIHPNTPEEKAEANKYESWFYNCGDTSTAAGHDHCDYTVSDCKRLGMWNTTTGILRFGGIEAEPPPTWTGRPFGGDTETRDNAKNHTLDSEYVPHLYGRGWIEPIVLNVSGEANYTRMQLLVCYGQTMAAIGLSKYSDHWKLAINDSVTQENASSGIFQPGTNGFWSFVSSGARDGALCNQVGYQVSNGAGGLTGGGDPFGSMTVLYASVLRRVTESNQVPTIQLLADGGMIPVFNSDDPADFTLKQTKNPVWQAIDMLMWGGRSYSDMRLSTFRAIAALADEQITASDRNGVAGTRPRFESCIVARHPRAIGDLLQGVLGSFGGYLVTTDKIELHMYQTLCSEQPSPIPGSNDNTGYTGSGLIGGFNGQTTKGNPGVGYVAYNFDASNIKEVNGHTSLRRLPVSMGDEPNTFSYTFQDSQNDYQLDTLTVPDVDAIKRNSDQQIVAAAPFEGITTYDQAFRMGRRSLARRLRGNPTGDPRGTWRMSFTASVKAVSLRLGHLVLLTADEFGLNKQLFRIESIKPALNFQEADLMVSWHEDALLMDDYGISGFPPISGSRLDSNRLPRTWQPFHKAIPATDPLYNGDPSYTFAMRQWLRDGEQLTDSMIRIQGYPPITLTAAMDIQPPWFTDQDLVSETGGTLMPDQLYYVCISVDDGAGKLSSPSTIRRIHMPPTGGNKQFRIQNLFWRGGGTAYVFVGLYPERLSFYKAVTGQPGTIIVGDTAVPRSSWGPPDSKAHHFVVRWRESIHAGVYGGAIAQVMPGGTSVRITGAAFVVNEWANRVMSVIGDANAPSTGDYFNVVNCRIASNTADTLVLSGSGDLGALGVQAGDAIVIRTVANIVSSTTIGDSLFVNSAASTGMGDEVIGREVVILWGTGMGQGRTITARTGTTLTVSQAWDIMPNAASVFVIEEIGWQTQETKPIEAASRPPVTPAVETITITDIPVQNWAARTIRVEVNVSDSVGKLAADALSREIYLYATFAGSSPDPWIPDYETPIAGDPLFTAKGFGIAPIYIPGASGLLLTMLQIFGKTPPDPNVGLMFRTRRELVSGIFAQTVLSITGSKISFGTPLGSMAAGLFNGRIISKLANPRSSLLPLPIADFLVQTSDTDGSCIVTPDPVVSGCGPGDLFTLRTGGPFAIASQFHVDPGSPCTWFMDDRFDNIFNVGGLSHPDKNKGNLALIIGGTGAGQPAQIVTANDGTKVTVSPGWTTPPDYKSVIVLLEATPREYNMDMSHVAGALIGMIPIDNYAYQVMRIEGYTTSGGQVGGTIEKTPFREIYNWGVQGTRTIKATTSQLPTDGMVLVDTTAGNVDFRLLPIGQVPNQNLLVVKVTPDANFVSVLCAAGDTFPDGSTSRVLLDNSPASGTLSIKAPGFG